MDDSYYKNLDKDKRDILLMLENKKKISNYEIEIDNYLKNRAIKNIISKPFKYLHLYFKKLLYFLFVNIESTYPNYFSLLVIVPELVYSIFAALGLYLNLISKKKNYKLAAIFLFYITIIPIFFILPRYKLFILPIMIYFITYFLNSIKNKKEKF